MKTIKLKHLTQDPEILEIRPVNAFFVSRYRQAMRAGADFPALIVEKETNNIISGNHRFQAMLEEYGGEFDCPVIWQSYPSEVERLEAAVRDNARHGNPLDGISRKRVACKLAELGRSPEQIAQLLGVAVKRVEKLGDETVLIRGKDKNRWLPVKHGLQHIAGQRVSKPTYDEHIKKDRGVPFGSAVAQIVRWIDNGWIDMADPDTVAHVESLEAAINRLKEGQDSQ
jgi:hypothetical protein